MSFTGICQNKIDLSSTSITVSSDSDSAPGSTPYSLDNMQSWCTEGDDSSNYIELALPYVFRVSGFSIGGSTNTGTQAFVKKFNVSSKYYLPIFTTSADWIPLMWNGSTVC